MNVLSFQSEVVFGHVGNGAARFALQRQGHEVWAVPTVLLSSHAAYPQVEGETIGADRIARLVDGMTANGWLARCDAVLSGYLGAPEQAEVVAEAVFRVKRTNPRAIYCLDPVMGDDERIYVKHGVAEAIARTLLPLSDVVTPNAFELVQLSGLPVRDRDDAVNAVARLSRPVMAATSIAEKDGRIGVIAAKRGAAWCASTPRLDDVPKGAGDLFAALFLSSLLSGAALPVALRRATASVYHVLTASAGREEMRLIAEQESLVDAPEGVSVEVEKIA